MKVYQHLGKQQQVSFSTRIDAVSRQTVRFTASRAVNPTESLSLFPIYALTRSDDRPVSRVQMRARVCVLSAAYTYTAINRGYERTRERERGKNCGTVIEKNTYSLGGPCVKGVMGLRCSTLQLVGSNTGATRLVRESLGWHAARRADTRSQITARPPSNIVHSVSRHNDARDILFPSCETKRVTHVRTCARDRVVYFCRQQYELEGLVRTDDR